MNWLMLSQDCGGSVVESASENCDIAGTKVLPGQAEIRKEERQSKQKICQFWVEGKQEEEREEGGEGRSTWSCTSFHA